MLGADARLVLDDQNAHQSSSSILRILPVAASTSTSLHLAVAAQDLELVDVRAVLRLELDLENFARNLRLHRLHYVGEGKDAALLIKLARKLVVAVVVRACSCRAERDQRSCEA